MQRCKVVTTEAHLNVKESLTLCRLWPNQSICNQYSHYHWTILSFLTRRHLSFFLTAEAQAQVSTRPATSNHERGQGLIPPRFLKKVVPYTHSSIKSIDAGQKIKYCPKYVIIISTMSGVKYFENNFPACSHNSRAFSIRGNIWLGWFNGLRPHAIPTTTRRIYDI